MSENYTSKLAIGEQTIADLINHNINGTVLEERLSSVLSACNFFGKANTFKVSIVKNSNSKEPFFGARIYPALDLITEIAEETVSKLVPLQDLQTAWQKIDHWIIELDSSIFDRFVINLIPKEIMAMILHEIGHTVYSDRVIERFYRGYKSMYVHMKGAEKDTIKLGYALFAVPLAASCNIRSWSRGRNGVKEEYFADELVAKAGYGDFYLSLISKIIEACGDSVLDETPSANDSKVSERVRWASINITDMVRRKANLSNEMYMSAAKTPSQYMKGLYAKVLNMMGVNLRERYTGDAVECTLAILNRENVDKLYEVNLDTAEFSNYMTCLESAGLRQKNIVGTPAYESIFKSKMAKGLPSWGDIDQIQIEIDKMTNHHDRSFVLDMIYSKIDDITEFMTYVGDARDRYSVEAQNMLDRLDSLRQEVLDRRSFASRYHVFVKSPDGYEG